MIISRTIKVSLKGKKKLWTYFERKAVITKSQDGFTKNKSCQSNLHPAFGTENCKTYNKLHFSKVHGRVSLSLDPYGQNLEI